MQRELNCYVYICLVLVVSSHPVKQIYIFFSVDLEGILNSKKVVTESLSFKEEAWSLKDMSVDPTGGI